MLNITYGLIGFYVLVAALLYVFQRTFLYFPTPTYHHEFEQITVNNAGENIKIIVLNSGNQNGFIYFGGNAETVLANVEAFSTHFANMTIYLVNYRGYGGSSGKPTEVGLFNDATAIFDTLSSSHTNLAVVGRSLGSGVAMHLAAHRPVSHIALITPFDSVLNLAKKQYPIFPISWLLKDKYDSISLAKQVTAPALIIAGGKDRLIPAHHSQNLADAMDQEKLKMVVIEQAGHNDISQHAVFYQSLGDFFATLNEKDSTRIAMSND